LGIVVDCYREKHEFGSCGCARARPRGRLRIKASIFFIFDSKFQVRGVEPKIRVVVCIVCFWWNYTLKFVMHMMEIGGC